MSKSEILHQLYNECKDIEFDESYSLMTKAKTDDEKRFIEVVTGFILQEKQKAVIAQKRF